MTKILNRLSSQLIDKGHSKKSAFAIATKTLQDSGNLKRGTNKPTNKGVLRGNMTPSLRAKQRASKLSGKPTSRYVYNSKTNRATLK